MPDGRRLEVRVTTAARRDIVALLRLSRERFGDAAATRYETLIEQGLIDIADDPDRPGLKARPEE